MYNIVGLFYEVVPIFVTCVTSGIKAAGRYEKGISRTNRNDIEGSRRRISNI